MASEDLEQWSERIYYSLPETGFSTQGKILSWLKGNTVKLNAAFGTAYAYNGSGIEPTLTSNHSGFYEELYYCSLFRSLAMKFVGADAYDLDLTETELEGQSRQRFVSRNERAKVYRSMANDCDAKLELLADDISEAESTSPLAAQILYSDRNHMIYGDRKYCPSSDLYSPNNTIWSSFYTYR